MVADINGDFAGHSLHREFITNLAKKKVPMEDIKTRDREKPELWKLRIALLGRGAHAESIKAVAYRSSTVTEL